MAVLIGDAPTPSAEVADMTLFLALAYGVWVSVLLSKVLEGRTGSRLAGLVQLQEEERTSYQLHRGT